MLLKTFKRVESLKPKLFHFSESQVLEKINKLESKIVSHSGRYQLADEPNMQEFKINIERSIKSIEEVIGKKVRTYRAPEFSIKEKK